MAESAAARRRALRQKKILANPEGRINKILGVPTLEKTCENDDTLVRRAPAFEGAPKYAYMNGQDSSTATNGLLDQLLQGGDGVEGHESKRGAEGKTTWASILVRIFWILLGTATKVLLSGPHSWLVGDNSMSVFSLAFCTHLILGRLLGSEDSVATSKTLQDNILELVMKVVGFGQRNIEQILKMKNYLSSLVETWSLFYLPFMACNLYMYLMS